MVNQEKKRREEQGGRNQTEKEERQTEVGENTEKTKTEKPWQDETVSVCLLSFGSVCFAVLFGTLVRFAFL